MNTTAPLTAPAPTSVWDEPAAARLKKPGWRDPRLIVGLILMTLGIGVGSIVVNAASNTVTVYAAATALPAGTPLQKGNLRAQQVRVPNWKNTYLNPQAVDEQWWAQTPVVSRPIAAGELIPQGALTTSAQQDLRPIAFSIPPGEATGIEVGTVVDLWQVPDRNSDARPTQVVAGVEVSAVNEDPGPLTVSGGLSITVLVPITEVETVLGAKSAPGAVELVAHLSGGIS